MKVCKTDTRQDVMSFILLSTVLPSVPNLLLASHPSPNGELGAAETLLHEAGFLRGC